MNAHDVAEVRDEGRTVVCACGRIFTGANRVKARTAHEGHWGVEHARAALERRGEAEA